MFIISGRSDAQSTLTVLRSVQSLKLGEHTASELFAKYTMCCPCENAVPWSKRELSTAMQHESTVECSECGARHSLRAIALIENRALNEQATDPRQYFSASVELAINSAEFSKQLGHDELKALWMVCQKAGDLWVLPLSFDQREVGWSALEEHMVYIEPCATMDTTAGLDTVSTRVIRSLELCGVRCPVGAWLRLVSKLDLVTRKLHPCTEDKLYDIENAEFTFTEDPRLQRKVRYRCCCTSVLVSGCN
jgi:hypothetical protein